MTRSIVAGWSAALALMVLSNLGCQATHVGDPCTPEQEYDKSFLGFSQTEVSVESKSFQCETRLCLVDHFQGRVSCPYGQPGDGGVNAPASGCVTPVTGVPVDGIDPLGNKVAMQATVLPQCLQRQAIDAVYCSCRCADVNGQTNDGANYCKCPDGFACTQLVPSLGLAAGGSEGLTGAYCVRSSVPAYDPTVCPNVPSAECQASKVNCGAVTGP